MVRVAIVLILAPSLAWADGRFALLIGNQAYTDKVGPLKNPHKDIAIVGKAPETDGFTVTALRDAGRRQVLSAVKSFAAQLAKGGANAVGFLLLRPNGKSARESPTAIIRRA
jgi:Caspase domain